MPATICDRWLDRLKYRLRVMQSKTETTYLDLRERILLGDLTAGSPMSAEDVAELTGVSLSMARQIILALGAGGYLSKKGRSYVVTTFTKAQIEEWRIALSAIVEIGALRLALKGGESLAELAQYLEDNVRHVAVDDEAFFLNVLAFTTMILGGKSSTLSELAEQFIPQAYFRLLWLSDVYADRLGYFVEAADRFLTAARDRDLQEIRKATRYFFDSTAPALHALVEHLSSKTYPREDPRTEKQGEFHTLEPKITGAPNYADKSRAITPLFRQLVDSDLVAYSF